MGKSSGSNKSVASTTYPEWQLPAVKRFVDESSRLYDVGGPQLYPGGRVTPFTANEEMGQQAIVNAAVPTTELADWSQLVTAFNLGAGRDPATNPYFQNSLNAAVRPITDQLLQQVLPHIRNQSVLSGTYGGSRQGIAEGLAVDKAAQAVGDVGAQMSNQNYQNAQNVAMQTMGFAPTLQQMWTVPGQLLSGVGAQQRAMSDALLNQQADVYEYGQRLPYQNLAEYGNMIRSPFGSEAMSAFLPQPASVGSQLAGAALSIPALIQILRQL